MYYKETARFIYQHIPEGKPGIVYVADEEDFVKVTLADTETPRHIARDPWNRIVTRKAGKGALLDVEFYGHGPIQLNGLNPQEVDLVSELLTDANLDRQINYHDPFTFNAETPRQLASQPVLLKKEEVE